jgi:hypothetical protein
MAEHRVAQYDQSQPESKAFLPSNFRKAKLRSLSEAVYRKQDRDDHEKSGEECTPCKPFPNGQEENKADPTKGKCEVEPHQNV